jgi:3-oxoacyl-[acyl-carrier-protein] synthase II
MNSGREIVITGIGVVSPIGVGQEKFWQSLLNGVSGIDVREGFSAADTPFRIAAKVKGFDAKQYVKPRKALKIMCEPIQFACAAAAMAFEHAKLDGVAISPDRIGTIFGTESFFANPNEVADAFRKCMSGREFDHDLWGEIGIRAIEPLWMLKYLPNMAASHIAISIDARGPSNSICQGEASGLLAMIEAADLIQRGVADIVLTGGTGSQMEMSAMLTRGCHKLSQRIHEPERACRPFDRDRDGMVTGEGAGAVVLESAEHASARGATPLARLAGWSRSFQDPEHADFPLAIQQNFEASLQHAQMLPSEIGLVNANASGSVRGDLVEAVAIERVFGQTPVVAHKGNFGNTGAGSSIVELLGAMLAIEQGIIPPTLNCDVVDPLCHVNVVTSKTSLEKRGVLKSSFSSSGQICSIILE